MFGAEAEDDRRLSEQSSHEPPEVDLMLAWERYEGWEYDPTHAPVLEDLHSSEVRYV